MLLNRNNLLVKDATSKEASNLGLEGVYITPRGTVAADGFMLVRVERPDVDDYPEIPHFEPAEPSGFKSTLIHRDSCDELLGTLKRLSKNAALPVFQNIVVGKPDDGKASFGAANPEVSETITVCALDKSYPPIDRVFPEGEPGFSIALSPKRLAGVLKTILAMDLETDQVVLHFFGPELGVYLVTRTKQGQKVEAIVMPRRDTVSYERPESWEGESKMDHPAGGKKSGCGSPKTPQKAERGKQCGTR